VNFTDKKHWADQTVLFSLMFMVPYIVNVFFQV